MTDKETGGAAFPMAAHRDFHGEWKKSEYGMTLRDYFAAKAMQGLIAADTGFTMPSARIAELAYDQADAMLQAREK